MNIGVIADTHDNMFAIKKAVELFKQKDIELVIHAGDHIAPFTTIAWKHLDKRIVAIFGNNDGDRLLLRARFQDIGEIYPAPYELNLNGKRILIIHEPNFLDILADSQKYDLIIYGHTHRRDILRNGKTLIVNPGEGGGWLTGESTAMIVNLDIMEVEELNLK